jgi:integrase
VASAYRKGSRWYLAWRDASGTRRREASTASSRAEARRMADDLERRAERQRLGLEALPASDGGGTLAELLRWWLETYCRSSPGYERTSSVVRKHLQEAELGDMRLAEVTSGRLEEHLQAMAAADYAAQTINHVRGFVVRAFNRARQSGRWSGPNPAEQVKRRRIPTRVHDYLKSDEVPLLLNALDRRWVPLFATAIFTGMRKGELLALRKRDMDLKRRRITVGRSWGRNVTKGGSEKSIPMATELRPFLEEAFAASPSELVFPKPDGSMMAEDVKLEGVLRRAMGRAGIAESWLHVCRRKGCGFKTTAADAQQRRCERCNMRLWPKPQVRPIRFHDLRHTTASLLMEAGAPAHAVRDILRHDDIRMTVDVYGHLSPEYLQAEVDRLSFGLWGSESKRGPSEGLPERKTAKLFTRCSPESAEEALTTEALTSNLATTQGIAGARDTGLEPVAFGSGGRRSIHLS